MVARKENGVYVVHDTLVVNRDKFEGTADQVKGNINLVVREARRRGMVDDGYFEVALDTGYCCDKVVEVTYGFKRTENESERLARVKAEEEAEEARHAAAIKRKKAAKAAKARKLKADGEYKEYLRLKQKFEDSE